MWNFLNVRVFRVSVIFFFENDNTNYTWVVTWYLYYIVFKSVLRKQNSIVIEIYEEIHRTDFSESLSYIVWLDSGLFIFSSD